MGLEPDLTLEQIQEVIDGKRVFLRAYQFNPPSSPPAMVSVGYDVLRMLCNMASRLVKAGTTRAERQARVVEFVRTRFGEGNMNRKERAARLLEEALEIAQTEGMTVPEVARLGNHVFSKPVGEPAQEAAGASIALLAYCESIGVSADAVEAAEIERVFSMPADYFRARHNAKAAAGVALPTQGSSPR